MKKLTDEEREMKKINRRRILLILEYLYFVGISFGIGIITGWKITDIRFWLLIAPIIIPSSIRLVFKFPKRGKKCSDQK